MACRKERENVCYGRAGKRGRIFVMGVQEREGEYLLWECRKERENICYGSAGKIKQSKICPKWAGRVQSV